MYYEKWRSDRSFLGDATKCFDGVTDHTNFYERYGWEFYCMAQGDGEDEMTRLYIHR